MPADILISDGWDFGKLDIDDTSVPVLTRDAIGGDSFSSQLSGVGAWERGSVGLNESNQAKGLLPTGLAASVR